MSEENFRRFCCCCLDDDLRRGLRQRCGRRSEPCKREIWKAGSLRLLLLLFMRGLGFVFRLIDEERKATVAVINIVVVDVVVVFQFLLYFGISVIVASVVPISIVSLLILGTTLWVGLSVNCCRFLSRRRSL